jgi:hypothetical protein
MPTTYAILVLFAPDPPFGDPLSGLAETELSVNCGQCLDRCSDEVAVVRSEVEAWEDQRDRTEAKVRWRFATEAARVTLETR